MTKEDAINIFNEQFCGLDVYCEIHQHGLCLTEECEIWWAIKALEQYKAGVQPVRHGHWEKDPRSKRTRCSECYSVVPRDDYRRECLSDYCSVCGARMDGEQDVHSK